jgi:hypothetical protein
MFDRYLYWWWHVRVTYMRCQKWRNVYRWNYGVIPHKVWFQRTFERGNKLWKSGVSFLFIYYETKNIWANSTCLFILSTIQILLAGQLFLNFTCDFLFHDLLFEWIFMKSFSKVHLNKLKFGLYDLLHLLRIKLLLPLLIFFFGFNHC